MSCAIELSSFKYFLDNEEILNLNEQREISQIEPRSSTKTAERELSSQHHTDESEIKENQAEKLKVWGEEKNEKLFFPLSLMNTSSSLAKRRK